MVNLNVELGDDVHRKLKMIAVEEGKNLAVVLEEIITKEYKARK